MTTRILRGDQVLAGIDPGDRGLAYGDGVFETLRAFEGTLPWWEAHWHRLCRGLEVLGFSPPEPQTVRAHALDLLAASPDAGVLKLVVTRGAGGRGYSPPARPAPTVILSSHRLPSTPATVSLRWCTTRWAAQPLLAGFKHLNRLEQVLARAEWDDPAVFDGIVLGTDGLVVGATSANVFARVGGAWLTPPVESCGIAGLMRDWVLRHAPAARVKAMTPAGLLAAEAVFLCNAVRGILPVERLDGHEWPAHPDIAGLRSRLAAAEPAFACKET